MATGIGSVLSATMLGIMAQEAQWSPGACAAGIIVFIFVIGICMLVDAQDSKR
jgi:hypothetical protein